MSRRLAWPLLFCALAASAVSGCGEDQQRERKRALLQPSEAKRKAAELREQRRLFDDKGELLPSGEVYAGIKLPKGLRLYKRFEQHSFYKSDEIPPDKLERFFGAQLMSTTVEHTAGGVTFGAAVPKDNLRGKRIDLRITRLRGREHSTEVYIREPPPPHPVLPPELDRANLEQARRYAD